MPQRSPLRTAVVLLAVVGLATVGCSAEGPELSAPTPASTTTEPDPTPTTDGATTTTTTEDAGTTTTEPGGEPVEPTVGECWAAVTGDDIEQVSFAGEPVRCSEPHGGVTVGVGDASSYDLTPELLDGDPTDPDVLGPVQEAGSTECLDAWNEVLVQWELDTGPIAVSTAQRATNLTRTFWLPTGDEWEAGARWVRCDLQTVDGTEFETADLDAIGTDGVPADLVQCLGNRGGTGEPVPCDSPDARWQAIATFRLPADVVPEDAADYRALLERALPLVCAQLTTVAVGDVGKRPYRIFAEPDFDLADGEFTCAAGVRGPVDEPLGT